MDELNKVTTIVYKDYGDSGLEVKTDGETVWLTQDQMCRLFGRDQSVIARHIGNVFKEGELERDSVYAKFAYTATDGKTYQVAYYNLDKEDGVRHKAPHVHAWYSGRAASFDARTGKILACGRKGFPERQANWIRTWMDIHKEELEAAWEMLKRGVNPPELPPLVR